MDIAIYNQGMFIYHFEHYFNRDKWFVYNTLKYIFCIFIAITISYNSTAQTICTGGGGNCPASPGDPPCWRANTAGTGCNATASGTCINFSNATSCSYNVRQCGVCANLTDGFRITADLFFGSNTSAAAGDGIAFILKPEQSSTGGIGGNIGYKTMNHKLFVVEFDTYDNGTSDDISCQHSAVYTRSATNFPILDLVEQQSPICLGGAGFDAKNTTNTTYPVIIEYNASSTSLRVTFNGTVLYTANIDLASILGTDCMVIGWSSATGTNVQDHSVCNINYQVLPVSLLEFKGEIVQGNGIFLNWKTAMEKNNKEFTLYRSKDIVNWEQIALVEGAGNSSSMKEYFYWDMIQSESTDNIYYKLKQADFDGTEEIFPIIVVKSYAKKENQIKVLPNPSNGLFQLVLHGEQNKNHLRNKIYNSQGQEVNPISIELRNNSVYINAGNLKQGIYSIETITEDAHFNNRVIIN